MIPTCCVPVWYLNRNRLCSLSHPHFQTAEQLGKPSKEMILKFPVSLRRINEMEYIGKNKLFIKSIHSFSQKQALLLTFGSRGSQPGLFTWPRGIAVGPDNAIVVADSSNHRVQVFNEQGQHRLSFGCYGNGEGETGSYPGNVTRNTLNEKKIVLPLFFFYQFLNACTTTCFNI